MKRLTVSIILFLNFISSAMAATIIVSSDKPTYFRYEVVRLYCEVKDTFNLSLTPWAPASNDSSTATVFFKNSEIKTIGNLDKITMHFDPVTKKWLAKWPIPWNPELGQYRAYIVFKSGNKKYSGRVNFNITGRKPYDLPKGFSSMNIEPGDSIIKRVPGVDGKTVKVWENYLLWAKFMGADALFHCVGQSQIWNELNPDTFPWEKMTLKQVEPLAAECHKQEMKYGAWITSFVLLGNRHDLSPYKQTTGYDKEKDALRKLIYISIYDEKRREDMINLLKDLQSKPDVDFLGLDYMRTDFGGYECANDFADEMPVETPADWGKLGNEERMLWLARQLELKHDPLVYEMWEWWRAHKMSFIIKDIKERAGLTKPLWVFSLTWKQGKEHGQDPLMFIDAGVDFNCGMYYSVEKNIYPILLDSWRNYLKQGNTALVAGQCVDWNLLGKTYSPPGPAEHFIRQQLLIDELLPVNPKLGLFWHDLTRAFKKSRGPYPPLEWAIAGAASFSYLREKEGLFPFVADWETPDIVKKGEIFTIEIEIKNSGSIAMDYYVKLMELANLEMFGDTVQKFYLAPGEIKTLNFQIKVNSRNAGEQNLQMLAFMVQYDGMKTQQRYFKFKYIEVK